MSKNSGSLRSGYEFSALVKNAKRHFEDKKKSKNTSRYVQKCTAHECFRKVRNHQSFSYWQNYKSIVKCTEPCSQKSKYNSDDLSGYTGLFVTGPRGEENFKKRSRNAHPKNL